ncbi:MAG: OsmC family protein [candidate division KSB1 bacterium]|nr:OsmC family protein [candidate division KSB1 bacterium]
MNAIVKQIDGLTLAGKSDSNHWVVMDTGKVLGGSEAGNKPMELVLIAMGGCTSMDVISILKKMRQDVRDYHIELEAEKATEHPAVFKKIHLKYVIVGKGIKAENVEKAIELSMTRYCSVSAMLKHSAEITWEYEIKEVE